MTNEYVTDNDLISLIIKFWRPFYKQIFGLNVDFSDIKIPEYQRGFDRVIVVAQGLTPNQVFQACKKRFPCWSYYEDLDNQLTNNDRNPDKQGYIIRIRDRIEADEELKGVSANNLAKKNIRGITLLERILLELKYFDETGKHLDTKSSTLCTGSRYYDGPVPRVRWGNGGLSVFWFRPSGASSFLRSREVIS